MSDIPEAFNQAVRQDLAEQGMEMTPDEVRHHRAEAYRKIRGALRAKGYEPPESDLELLAWMSEVMKRGK